jgi:hypothetical protein
MSPGAALLLALLAIGWMWLVGWAIARLFCASLSLPEVIAWSLACGFVFQGRFYEALLLVGAHAAAGSLVAAGGAVIAFSLIRRRPSARLPDGGRPEGRVWALAAALSVPWLVFALESIAEPMWTTDYLAIWGLKAKIIFFSAAIPDRLFHDPFTFWSHPEYPLLLPLSLASLAAMLGRFDDQALALLYPAFEAATILLLFGHLRRRISLAAGAAAASAAALCFPLYRAVNAGSAEIPLAFAFVLAGTAFLDSLDDDTTALRVRLLIASHLCATLKQEGALFVGLLALACFVRWAIRRKRSGLVAGFCLLLPVILHAALRRIAAAPESRRDFDFTLLSPGRSSELAERGLDVVRHLLRVELPGAALPIAGLVLLLLFSRRRSEDVLLPVLLAQVAAYAAAASLSAFGPSWQLESAFGRTTVALVPVLAVVLGARASSLTAPTDAAPQRTR